MQLSEDRIGNWAGGELTTIAVDVVPLTRQDLRDELDRTLAHYATKADLADVRADLHALEARLIKWMLGLMLSATGLAVAIAIAVDRLWT